MSMSSLCSQAQRHLKELVKPPEEATWGGVTCYGMLWNAMDVMSTPDYLMNHGL